MRALKNLLTLFGAACIGLALGGFVAADLPLYRVNNIITVARCALVLGTGITSLVLAFGIRRPVAFAWWVGCFVYMVLIGYFSWRTVTRFEMLSFFILIVLVGESPFAAMWWRYARLVRRFEEDQ